MNDEELASYLNDHLGGSVAGIELARDCLAKNRNSELGSFLEMLIRVLEEEQLNLKKTIAAINAYESILKKVGGWFAEKVGRMRVDNIVTGYTDFSRLIELELLILGVHGQLRMWLFMDKAFSKDTRFAGLNFSESAAKIREMMEALEKFHLSAAGPAAG